MGEAIGQVLGNGVGVALSPVPIIALILMLLSESARANSVAFLLGWLLGILLLGGVLLASGLGGGDGESSTLGLAVKLVIGLLFLLLAAKQWRSRPREGQEPEMPGWMASVVDFSPGRAFGLAAALASVNPKNLGLTVAAATSISASGLATGGEVVVLLVYTAVASTSVALPVGYYFVGGEGARATLDATRTWLVGHSNVVMTVLFLVLGAKVLGEGLAVLG